MWTRMQADSREAAHISGTTEPAVQQSKDCSAQVHIDVEVRSELSKLACQCSLHLHSPKMLHTLPVVIFFEYRHLH